MHRVTPAERVRTALLRGPGVLVRGLVVAVGVERQHGIRAGCVGPASATGSGLGGASRDRRAALVRVGFGDGLKLRMFLLVAAGATAAMVATTTFCK